jgi:hypothetical protein
MQRGRDHRIRTRSDRARHSKRSGNIGAVIYHTVRLKRPGRQQHGLYLARHLLFEFHPVDALHLARGNGIFLCEGGEAE